MWLYVRTGHRGHYRGRSLLLAPVIIIGAELAWAPFLLSWTFRVLFLLAVVSAVAIGARRKRARP